MRSIQRVQIQPIQSERRVDHVIVQRFATVAMARLIRRFVAAAVHKPHVRALRARAENWSSHGVRERT
eukprot:7696976-Lingulodinium_polyedra.AAC.1